MSKGTGNIFFDAGQELGEELIAMKGDMDDVVPFGQKATRPDEWRRRISQNLEFGKAEAQRILKENGNDKGKAAKAFLRHWRSR